jgi:putative membrane protein
MMRIIVFALTLIGLGFAIWLIHSIGVGEIVHAAQTMGALGYALYLAYSLLVLVLLGFAWHAAMPGVAWQRWWLFAWGRTTRAAAADILPFSQLGGLLVGARTVAAHGFDQASVYASMIVDITTEMAAQLVYTLFGIAVLAFVVAGARGQAGVLPTALGGLALSIAIMLGFVFAQGPALGLLTKAAARLLPGSVAGIALVRERLGVIYGKRRRVLGSFLLNLAAWFASGAGAWIALSLMGAHVPLWAVLTIEALIAAVRSVAFLVPGAIGLQEGAYVLLGPVLGIDPGLALALSLIKRARDMTIGIPAILLWQLGEARSLVAKPAAR